MWFYMIALFLVLVGIIGGALSGGIFTIIFIPLGAIMLVVAVLFGMWSRAREAGATPDTEGAKTEQAPLRHTPPQGAPTPTRPEELADARRVQQ